MPAYALSSRFNARPASASTSGRVRGLRVQAFSNGTTAADGSKAASAGLVHGPKNIVSLRPYFTVTDDNMEAFMAEAAKANEKMAFGREPDCVHYGWTRSGNVVQCYESYLGGDAALHHISRCEKNIEMLCSLASDIRIEIHGIPEELEKMKEPLKDLEVEYFEGFAPVAKDPLANYDDPLEKYCKDNEDADECRVYED